MHEYTRIANISQSVYLEVYLKVTLKICSFKQSLRIGACKDFLIGSIDLSDILELAVSTNLVHLFALINENSVLDSVDSGLSACIFVATVAGCHSDTSENCSE